MWIRRITYILLSVSVCLVTACQSGQRAVQKKSAQGITLNPEAAHKRWHASTLNRGYELTYRIICVCESMPVVTVRVNKAGKVVAVKASPEEETPTTQDAMTVERLFKIIDRSLHGSEPASSVKVKFNASTGAPEVVSVAQEGGPTDAEEQIVILKLKLDG